MRALLTLRRRPLPLILALACVCLLQAGVARADGAVDPFAATSEESLFRLEEEVVAVSSGYAQLVKQAPNIVESIPARRLRELGINTIAEALRLVAGVHVTVGFDGRELAFFRGTLNGDNNKMLLLVDGVPWNDPLYHHSPIDDYLPLEQVARLEIIRGPGSARYGTGAFAGVVNVVTVQGAGIRGIRVTARGGSYGLMGLHLVGGDSFLTPWAEGQISAYARYQTREGDGPTMSPRGRRRVLANDPRRSLVAGLRLHLGRLQLSADAVDYRHLRLASEQDTFATVVGSSTDLFNYRYYDHYVELRYDWEPGLGVRLVPRVWLQEFNDSGSYGAPSTAGSVVDDEGLEQVWARPGFLVDAEKRSERLGTSVELSHRFEGLNYLSLGAEAVIERFRQVEDITFAEGSHDPATATEFKMWDTPRSIYNLAAFVQETFTPHEMLGLTAGGRVDSHRYFGTQVSPRVAAVLNPMDWLTLKLAWGRAFRAPIARELLVQPSPGLAGAWTEGNTELTPERIQTIEGELSLRPLEALLLSVSAYSNQVDGEIADVAFEQVAGQCASRSRYQNLTQGSSVLGVDAEARWASEPFEARLNYSFTQAVDEATDRPQYGIPEHMANAAFTVRMLRPLAISTVGHYVGTRPRAVWSPRAGAEDGQPYMLVDVHLLAEELFSRRLRVGLSLRNITDAGWERLRPRGTADTMTLKQDEASGSCQAVAPYYTHDLEGPGRRLEVFVEGVF